MFHRYPVLHYDILFSSRVNEYFNMLNELTILSRVNIK